MDYYDFAIGFEPGEPAPASLPSASQEPLGPAGPAEATYELRVSSPAGQCSGRFRLPPAATDVEGLRSRLAAVLRGAAPPSAGGSRDLQSAHGAEDCRVAIDPRRLGEDLFNALFCGRVKELYDRSLGLVRGSGLRVRLRLDPARPRVARLCGVPWELMRPAECGPLSLSFETPVVRFLEVARPVLPVPLEGPLRVLMVLACPDGYAPLDLPAERDLIAGSWGRQPGVELEVLEGPSLERLGAALLARPRHVIHFMGHGDFDVATGEGSLVFAGVDRRPLMVSGAALAARLPPQAPTFLVVLNACNTSRQVGRDGLDPFAGAAAALVREGLLAVVAMQLPISDAAARAFSGGLYSQLAAGSPLEAAVTSGRLAIRESGSEEWATPVLLLRSERAVAMPFSVPRSIAENFIDASGYVAEKTAGFVGRKFVFDAIDRFIGRSPRGYFFVRGDPGIGKTALIAQLVKQRGYVHHFNIASQNIGSSFLFLRNVCARLIAAYRLEHASLPPDAASSSAFLVSLLEVISRRLAPGEKAIVLIDALDEADRSGLGGRANVLCLPPILPAGTYIVATTRIEGETQLPLYVECEHDTLFLDPLGQSNLADVEELVTNRLAEAGIQAFMAAEGLDERRFAALMVDRSEGNFIYLHHVLREIAAGFYAGRPLAAIPKGLTRYYEQHWRRLRSGDEEAWLAYRLPILMALTVVREPVPIDLIAAFSGVDDPIRILRALNDWRHFLHVESVREGDAEEMRYRLYHMSFFDFIKGKDEIEVSFKEAHRRVLEAMKQG
jgi:CHAT domain